MSKISFIIITTLLLSLQGIAKDEKKKRTPKIDNGTLVMSSHPKELKKYLKSFSTDRNDFYLNLKTLRESCNFLTDTDVLKINRDLLSKRKKAFKRRVKYLCENLEQVYFDQAVTTKDDLNLLYELETLRLSYIDRAKQKPISFIDKIKMMITGRSQSFIVKKSSTLKAKDEAKNLQLPEGKQVEDLGPDELAMLDPAAGPYWQPEIEGLKPRNRFKHLQKLKRINKVEPLYVLFESSSLDGSAPKIKTIDLDLDNEWSIKWGDEVHTDVVGSRIFAGLGYDVDHPYYYGKDLVKVILPPHNPIKETKQLITQLKDVFEIDISRFIHKTEKITTADVAINKKLAPYIGWKYISFVKCLIEARPDRVKRLGSLIPKMINQEERRELRGSLLAHLWIDNWDTKKENTLITTIHKGNWQYRMSGAFSDLGTSMGVKLKYIPTDFRVGLVNHYPWDIIKKISRGGKRIVFHGKMNTKNDFFKSATYSDLKWMAYKIAKFSKKDVEKIVEKAQWPKPIEKLYFLKLANRRQQILSAFNITDSWPMEIDSNINIAPAVRNGELVQDLKSTDHPLGFLDTHGRLRNYGGDNQ